MAPARPRFLFEPGHVRVGARGLGGIKQGGGTGQAGGPGKGGGPAKGGGPGKGRGQGATLTSIGQFVSAFGAIASSRGVVPSPPDVAGALTLLSTTTLASPGTFDVSGISGAYNDLLLVLIARGADAAALDSAIIRFNNDSATNYTIIRNYGNNNVIQSIATTLSSGGIPGQIPAAGATANLFGAIQVTIPGYASTAWLKSALAETHVASALSAAGLWRYGTGWTWNSTAAITRIQVSGSTTANLATGSQLRIYGCT